MKPINKVPIGPATKPEFLNASPMAKRPDPMLAFNMWIRVSRYLEKNEVSKT